MALADGLIDFIEIGTGVAAQYYDILNMGFQLPVVTGSDFPHNANSNIGDARVYVHTGSDRTLSVDRWFSGIKQGNTYTTNGPLVTRFDVDGSMPGQTVHAKSGTKLKIQAVIKGHPAIGSPKRVSLLKFGKEIEEAVSHDPNQDTLAADWELTVDRSCWLALRVEAHNGTRAHTSAVYVVVDGKTSTHDPDQIAEAAQHRIDRLKEMAASLEDDELAAARDKINDHPNLSDVRQKIRMDGFDVLRRHRNALLKQIKRGIRFFERLPQTQGVAR